MRTGPPVRGVPAAATAAPATLAELSAALGEAARADLAVVPWGGGTGQARGRPPGRPFLLCQTGRLDQVLSVEPGDLTIAVQAGVTLAALRARLREAGLMLPVDPPLPSRATVGGVLAREADGPRRLRHGGLRDLLIGITVVEASGRVSKAGAQVVKNVSGYDLMKLYVGSEGTLALIAEARFKVLPLPRASATVRALFADPGGALALAAAIAATPLLPAAVEYLAGGLAAGAGVLPAAGEPLAGGQAASAGGVPPAAGELLAPGAELLVRAEGTQAVVGRHLRDVLALSRAAGALHHQVLEGADEVACWAAADDAPQTAHGDDVVVRLCTLPAALAGLLRALPLPPGVTAQVSARALCGVAHLRLRGPDRLMHEGLRLLAAAARAAAPESQLTVLAPGAAALQEATRPPQRPAGLGLMQRLRAEFDPGRRLNPGRLCPWE